MWEQQFLPTSKQYMRFSLNSKLKMDIYLQDMKAIKKLRLNNLTKYEYE